MMEENYENFSRLSKDNFDIISILIEEKIYYTSEKYRKSEEAKEEYNMCKAMEDWKKVLLAEGKSEGEQKLGKLVALLMSEKQYDEVNKAVENEAYRNTLYGKYNIV